MLTRFFFAPQIHNTWPKLYVLTQDGVLFSEYLENMSISYDYQYVDFEEFKSIDYKFKGYQSLQEIDYSDAISKTLVNQANWVNKYINNYKKIPKIRVPLGATRPWKLLTEDKIIDDFNYSKSIGTVEVWNIASLEFKSLSNYLKNDVLGNEKDNIRDIEIKSIAAFLEVSVLILDSENPKKFIRSEDLQIFLDPISELAELNPTQKEIVLLVNLIKYVMTNGDMIHYKVRGNIPRSKWYNLREWNANNWYKEFIIFRLDGLIEVLKKSDCNKLFGKQYIWWSCIFYLERTYPNMYIQGTRSMNDYVYDVLKDLSKKFHEK